MSRNVSEGSAVVFSCATPYGTTVSLTWSIPGVSGYGITNSDLPGGGKRTTASFMVTASNNNTDIACALLMGQLMDPMCL